MKKLLLTLVVLLVGSLAACQVTTTTTTATTTTTTAPYDATKTISVYTRDTTSGTRAGFMENIGFAAAATSDSVLVPGFIIKDNTSILNAMTIDEYGIGIPKNEQARVFERFYRVDKARSQKVSGTGLGLSIVKHIAMHYEGEIELYSEPEKGTTVTVRIPRF